MKGALETVTLLRPSLAPGYVLHSEFPNSVITESATAFGLPER